MKKYVSFIIALCLCVLTSVTTTVNEEHNHGNTIETKEIQPDNPGRK